MIDRMNHAASLEDISHGVALENDHGKIREAAAYIRTLEGLVRDAESAVRWIEKDKAIGRITLGRAKAWQRQARALGLTEDK